MVDLTDRQIKAAEARGWKMHETELRASSVKYEPATGKVVLDLVNGCTYAFPAGVVQDLVGASDENLGHVELDGAGFNLHWPTLDVDLFVPAIGSGVFGARKWMAGEFARIAGPARSPAKGAARLRTLPLFARSDAIPKTNRSFFPLT
jgi:hypothetical protein